MPSSTSSSRVRWWKWPFEPFLRLFGSREKGPVPWASVGRRLFFTVFIATVCWEGCWRLRGFVPTHKDDVGLWTDERDRLKTAGPGAFAVIGSSRIFYGLETDMIRERTGWPVVQLAVNGMSPVPVLEDLAGDDTFTGTVLCGVSIQSIFGHEKYRQKGEGWVKAYKRQTRIDRWNHKLTMILEKLFVYPGKEEFFSQFMTAFQILTSDDVTELWGPGSKQLTIVDERRGSYVTDYVVNSEGVREVIISMQLRDIGKNPKPIAPEGEAEQMQRIRDSVAKILARGGRVVFFILYPSGGKIWHLETATLAAREYWEPIAAIPGVTGIHYTDHPVLAEIKTVEDSHISRPDRKIFTRILLEELTKRGILDR